MGTFKPSGTNGQFEADDVEFTRLRDQDRVRFDFPAEFVIPPDWYLLSLPANCVKAPQSLQPSTRGAFSFPAFFVIIIAMSAAASLVAYGVWSGNGISLYSLSSCS